jgi:hypothetical protein
LYGQNVINLLKHKVAQYVAISLGIYRNDIPKAAQLAKNAQSGPLADSIKRVLFIFVEHHGIRAPFLALVGMVSI